MPQPVTPDIANYCPICGQLKEPERRFGKQTKWLKYCLTCRRATKYAERPFPTPESEGVPASGVLSECHLYLEL